MKLKRFTREDLAKLYRPAGDSHKGENGRLLVLGGSELFHASIFWTADVASRIVDLVHFSSPAGENNDLVRERAKRGFWNGIVVDWDRVGEYIKEDEAVVVGPGMPRVEGLGRGERSTEEIVGELLSTYASAKWVVDGGALQEANPRLFNSNMVITPHQGEFCRLLSRLPSAELRIAEFERAAGALNGIDGNNGVKELAVIVRNLSERLGGVTILLKGVSDLVYRAKPQLGDKADECFVIEGGNEGLSKGGTGDVLAGLTGAFLCKNDSVLAACAASLILNRAADELYSRVGAFYNTSDLVEQIPKTMKSLIG